MGGKRNHQILQKKQKKTSCYIQILLARFQMKSTDLAGEVWVERENDNTVR